MEANRLIPNPTLAPSSQSSDSDSNGVFGGSRVDSVAGIADVIRLIPNGVALDLSCITSENVAQNSVGVSYTDLVDSANVTQLNPSYNPLVQNSTQPINRVDVTENLPSLTDFDVSQNLQFTPVTPEVNANQSCFLKDLDSGNVQLLQSNLTTLEPGEVIGSDQLLKVEEAAKQLNSAVIKQNWVNINALPNNLTYTIIDAANGLNSLKPDVQKPTLATLQPLSNANIISLCQKNLDSLVNLQKIQLLQANSGNLSLGAQGQFLLHSFAPTNISAISTSEPAAYDQPSSTTDSNQSNQEEINTKEVAMKISNELKKYSIPQAVFAQQVLGRSQGTLSDLLRNPKPWSKLKSGRETFRRMWNWMKEPESERMAQLRLCASSMNQEGHPLDSKPSASSTSLPNASGVTSALQPTTNKRSRDAAQVDAGESTPPGFTGKKPRMVFTEIQRRTLVAIFKEIKRPSKEIQATIAEQLGLKVSTVVNFFMNARRRSIEKYLDDTVTTTSASTTTLTTNDCSSMRCTTAKNDDVSSSAGDVSLL